MEAYTAGQPLLAVYAKPSGYDSENPHHDHPQQQRRQKNDFHDCPATAPCSSSCCRPVHAASRRSGRTGQLCLAVAARARRTLRFLLVFCLLLVLAEALLTVAVFAGYGGATYLRRVRWHADGSLTLEELRKEFDSELREQDTSSTGAGEAKHGQSEECQGQDVITTTEQDPSLLPPCPLLPPGLQGQRDVDLSPPPSFRELEEKFWMLQNGGRFRPKQCRAQQKVAVILPYRDRRVHLKLFLRYMHPFLQKQQLDYTIFLIELAVGIEFNRALLFNVGFRESLLLDNFTCFIFHDVDLLPENDRIFYRCSENMPRHLSVAVDRMKYKLPYATIFGGVTAMTREQFEKVNGFSNMYFGWGGEDDDMSVRIRSHGYQVARYSNDIARYKSMGHAKADKNPGRLKLLNQGPTRFRTDGLNSLNYTRLDYEAGKLYTWVLVSVNKDAILADADVKPSLQSQVDRKATSKTKATKP